MASTSEKNSIKEQSLVIVNDFYKALSVLDSDKLLTIMAEDIIVNISGSTPISGCVDRKQLIEIVFPLLFNNLDLDNFNFCTRVKIMCAENNFVTAIMEADGLSKNGKRYNQRYCHIFQCSNEKVQQLWEFFDSKLVMSCLYDDNCNDESPFSSFEF
jgi:ketosteroid isomerase-like protein